MSIDELEKFLKEFSQNIRYEEPTFMEVTGYPHYEKVCSNILGFYFDPDREHGFGTLVLNALMRSAKIQLELDDSRFEIETEYPTTKDNYIDLVIYNDELAIGIENKIFATVYNDLDDYAKTIDELGKVSYKIILSLNDESKIANEHNFINVTYNELFSNLRELIGEKWDKTNKWHLFLQEFMQTLENLKKEKSIDKQNLEWAKNNRKQILSVNRILKYNYADDEMQGLLQKYRKEVRKFNDFISEMKNDFNFQTNEFERFIRQNLDYKRFNVNKFWRHRDLQNLSYMCIFEMFILAILSP